MVLSSATGLWRFKGASLLASSMEVAELVASLMAESDGKNGVSRVFWWQRVWQQIHGKLSWKFSNHILAAAGVSTFDGSFLTEHFASTLSDKEAIPD